MTRIRTISVGRSSVNDVCLGDGDGTVSRRHIEVTIGQSGDVLLTDCNSTCGTYVLENQEWQSVSQKIIRYSDQIRLGNGNSILTVDEILRMGSR